LSEVTIENTINKIVVSECGNNIELSGLDQRSIIVSSQGVQGVAGNGSVWGDIGGVLSDQTDLQNELDTKLTFEESDIIRQADSGNKSFPGSPLSLITISDDAKFTNNTKSFTYSSSKLITIVHQFGYNSQTWTFTKNFSYIGDDIANITETLIKV